MDFDPYDYLMVEPSARSEGGGRTGGRPGRQQPSRQATEVTDVLVVSTALVLRTIAFR